MTLKVRTFIDEIYQFDYRMKYDVGDRLSE